MTNLLTERPSRFAKSENLRRVLGLRNSAVFETLMRSPRLSARIDEKIEAQLGSVTGLPDEIKRTAETLMQVTHEEFQKISKVVGVLAQARKIKRTVCGQQLGEVVAYCGNKDILRFVRDNELPAFPGIRPCASLDAEGLEASAKVASSFLFGLMPRSFQMRLVLAREPSELTGALECPTQEGRAALMALLDAATAFLRSQEATEGKA